LVETILFHNKIFWRQNGGEERSMTMMIMMIIMIIMTDEMRL